MWLEWVREYSNSRQLLNGAFVMMEDTNHKTMNDERCFVCDGKVQGRFYVLATCKTQTSRSRVIEKLGELVGER